MYEIKNNNNRFIIGEKFVTKPAAKVGLLEKDIEDFIASRPEILFPNEEILVIGQSIAYQSMADVLALDALGNLIIIEIKRNYSDRETVGQLLEYAAQMKGITYDELNNFAQSYKEWAPKYQNSNLNTVFREFSDDATFEQEKIGHKQRIVIVAPQSDEGLQQIVKWLRSYGVPVEFIPFNILADEHGQPRLLDIQGVEDTPELVSTESTWKRHWIFNTNETNAKGAYQKMFEKNVAAIYGYDDGPKRLQGSTAGDTILAYVNRKGIKAIGKVVSGKVLPGSGIFLDKEGHQLPDEYHLEVEWTLVNQAMTQKEASEIGYNLPVRTVFGKLHKGELAEKMVKVLENRSKD